MEGLSASPLCSSPAWCVPVGAGLHRLLPYTVQHGGKQLDSVVTRLHKIQFCGIVRLYAATSEELCHSQHIDDTTFLTLFGESLNRICPAAMAAGAVERMTIGVL